MKALKVCTYKSWFALTACLAMLPCAALAADLGSANDVTDLEAGSNLNLRDTMLRVLSWVLNFLALVAVIMLVGIGVAAILRSGSGSDEGAGKGKKAFLYVIVGLVVIILARVVVAFVTKETPNLVM